MERLKAEYENGVFHAPRLTVFIVNFKFVSFKISSYYVTINEPSIYYFYWMSHFYVNMFERRCDNNKTCWWNLKRLYLYENTYIHRNIIKILIPWWFLWHSPVTSNRKIINSGLMKLNSLAISMYFHDISYIHLSQVQTKQNIIEKLVARDEKR